jgi:integrase
VEKSEACKTWLNTLETYVYPVLGDVSAQAVDVSLVMRALERPIGEDKKPFRLARPETASRVRGRIESVLDWATARGYRQGENPARWRGHLENLLPQRSKLQRIEHHAALPYGEIGAFMAELREQHGAAARALEFLVLTAGRAGEVAGARWGEIDLPGRLWVVPGKRMKSGKEHRVPLSSAAIDILDQMQKIRSDEFVFPGRTGRGIGHSSLLKLLARMGHGDLTAHGFRSTFADWCSERTNFPAEVREMALAHAVGDKVEAAYRRGDLFQKRRQLMDAWGQYQHGGAATPN